MIASKEVRKLIEDTMEKYEKLMIEEKFLEATWALGKLKTTTQALMVLKEEF